MTRISGHKGNAGVHQILKTLNNLLQTLNSVKHNCPESVSANALKRIFYGPFLETVWSTHCFFRYSSPRTTESHKSQAATSCTFISYNFLSVHYPSDISHLSAKRQVSMATPKDNITDSGFLSFMNENLSSPPPMLSSSPHPLDFYQLSSLNGCYY